MEYQVPSNQQQTAPRTQALIHKLLIWGISFSGLMGVWSIYELLRLYELFDVAPFMFPPLRLWLRALINNHALVRQVVVYASWLVGVLLTLGWTAVLLRSNHRAARRKAALLNLALFGLVFLSMLFVYA